VVAFNFGEQAVDHFSDAIVEVDPEALDSFLADPPDFVLDVLPRSG